MYPQAKSSRLPALLVIAAAACVVFIGHAKAQTPEGITVSPARVIISADKNIKQSETVTVRNNTSNNLTYSIELKDITQSSDGSLVPDDKTDADIANAIEYSPQEFTLAANSTQDIIISFKDTEKLPPGGHYGILVIKQISDSDNNVALQPAVSVTVFATKLDGAAYDMTVDNVQLPKHTFSIPNSMAITFKNKGNVAIVPRASVQILSPTGALVANSIVNEQSIPVFPANTITVRSGLQKQSKSWLPGFYTVKIIYRYDGTDLQQVISRQIFVAPPIGIAFCVLALVTVVGLLRVAIPRLRRLIKTLHAKRQSIPDGPSSRGIAMDIISPKNKKRK